MDQAKCFKNTLLVPAGALGRPRGMVWGGGREEGSGWGACVYLKFEIKIKKKNNKNKTKQNNKYTVGNNLTLGRQ